LIDPTDLGDKDALNITLITHAQKQGMSVLRGSAPDAEFQTIISQRVKDPAKRKFHGVSIMTCALAGC
jgi:hypothetical protein